MITLVSPTLDFQAFCEAMVGHDLLWIIDTASTEATYAQHLHEQASGRFEFRPGSRGRRYCDDLQSLVSMLMNGRVPADASAGFTAAVKPLVIDLLKKWDISDLRSVFFAQEPVRAKSGNSQNLYLIELTLDMTDAELVELMQGMRRVRESIEDATSSA
jgi:hypothetical protein